MNHNGRGFWDAAVSISTAAQQFHNAAGITAPYEGNPLALTLCIVCCNQESTIEATLNSVTEAMRVVGISYEIIVIDDASRDRSVELLRRYMDAHSGMPIVLRVNGKSKGLAENVADAAFIGRGQYFRLIAADHAEPMETLVDILKATGEADIIIPYYVASMQEGGIRPLMSRLHTRLLNLASGQRLNDYSGSPVHLRFNVMRWHAGALRCSFQTDLLCRLLDLGFTCKQVPCRTLRRRALLWKDILPLPGILWGMVVRRVGG